MGVDISGLVASGVVSAVVAMAFKYFDRPHSRLVATGLNVVVPVGHERDWDETGAPVSITNFGTGSAYNLHFAGSDCIVSTVRPQPIPWICHVTRVIGRVWNRARASFCGFMGGKVRMTAIRSLF